MRGDVPLISVVFPVYDNVDTLKVTLPAILSQDLPSGLRHEVIVVDDGSPENVEDLVKSIHDPRIRYVRRSANGGAAAALPAARG